jgi:hypothetical protein
MESFMRKLGLLGVAAVAVVAITGCAGNKRATSSDTTPVQVAKNTYTSESRFGKVTYSIRPDSSPGSTHVVLRCEESSTGTCVVVSREPGRGDNQLRRLRAGEELPSGYALHEFVYCVQPLVAEFPLQVVCLPKPGHLQQ